jgi:hypothetical protein
MTGETLRRGSAWILASGVAAIAATVSFSHIYDLGRAYGGSQVAARLLPLSVDLLILVGELMLLHESDARGRRFRPGWALVVSGIAATMAANVTFGAQFGAVGAVIWGWPAYSFVLVAWGMVAMVKRVTAATGSDSGATMATGSDRVRDILKTTPTLPKANVAEMAGVSARTVERVKRELNGAAK